jgi:hypothetical protein
MSGANEFFVLPKAIAPAQPNAVVSVSDFRTHYLRGVVGLICHATQKSMKWKSV